MFGTNLFVEVVFLGVKKLSSRQGRDSAARTAGCLPRESGAAVQPVSRCAPRKARGQDCNLAAEPRKAGQPNCRPRQSCVLSCPPKSGALTRRHPLDHSIQTAFAEDQRSVYRLLKIGVNFLTVARQWAYKDGLLSSAKRSQR